MLNNKGQSLVLFVMIIPIFLLLCVLVMDVGEMFLIRRELDNINYISIDYGIDNINEDNVIDKIKDIIYKNDSLIKIVYIKKEDNKIYISTEKKYDGHFLGFISRNFINIKSSYMGYVEGEKRYIERVK